ncbi:MAG: aldo/keto reductase [Verrucomicrobiota bacterium]|jgi:predicted aldo/keto reductase-like oxidoreductase
MQFRKFGKLDWNASVLGFGAMRLPTVDGNALGPNINQPEAIRMIRRALDGGVNYFDTAYVYHDGASETVLGKALRGARDSVKIATKSPVWAIQIESDFDRILNEQLRKLQTDHIDFYLLHALDKKRWRETVPKFKLLEKSAAAIADGRVRHLGFSFHDNYECFAEILNGFDHWEFCQIQYNYMDTENQAGTQGLELAAAHGLAVVIMEPLLGGRLANPPSAIRQVIENAGVRRAPADWALQWLWDRPEVSVVLSGMSNMEQVEANLESASRARSHSFQAAEQKLIADLRQKYQERAAIPCTKCNYCMPCPNGVDIPAVFEIYNEAFLHEDVPGARFKYQIFIPEPARAGVCLACHECEDRCPQRIPVSDWMPKVHALLGAA